jgi:hypothetical protein
LKTVSKKTVATATILLLFSLVTGSAVFTAAYTAMQSINPAAALAALTVAAVGFLWFKKTS